MTDQIRAYLISDLQVLFSPGYSLFEVWLKGTSLFFFVWFIFKALLSLGSRASIPSDSPLAWSDKWLYLWESGSIEDKFETGDVKGHDAVTFP